MGAVGHEAAPPVPDAPWSRPLSPRVDHRKPAIAFAVLLVVAAVVVGNGLRADAQMLQRLWAGVIGAHATVTGAEPSGQHTLDEPAARPSPPGTSTHEREAADHGERRVAQSRSLPGTRRHPPAGEEAGRPDPPAAGVRGHAAPGRAHGHARGTRGPVRPAHAPRWGTGPRHASGHLDRVVPGPAGRDGERVSPPAAVPPRPRR